MKSKDKILKDFVGKVITSKPAKSRPLVTA
jgi:hypothetical protein